MPFPLGLEKDDGIPNRESGLLSHSTGTSATAASTRLSGFMSVPAHCALLKASASFDSLLPLRGTAVSTFASRIEPRRRLHSFPLQSTVTLARTVAPLAR